MVTWRAGNYSFINSYNPDPGQLGVSNIDADDSRGRIYLASNGTVDANGITRIQYPYRVSSSPSDTRIRYDRASGQAFFTTTTADRDAAGNSGRTWTAVAFLTKASNFAAGVIPTFSQILALGDSNVAISAELVDPTVVRKVGDVGGYISLNEEFTSAPGGPLQPGTKYWMAVSLVATAGTTLPALTIANLSRPLSGTTLDTFGRVISFWTNRAPNAPTITSPVPGSTYSPGNTFNLSFTSNDPDAFAGGTTYKYTDLAGVQVQYAARPTPENPVPTWTDLPIANNAGTALGEGWAIYKSTALSSTSGSFNFLNNKTMVVRAGSNTLTANQAALPSGDWQIRVRTFDWGTPHLDERYGMEPFTQPLGANQLRANLKPSLYPAANTSPWSTPINVSVVSQVPPPIPLSPINSTAVSEAGNVDLRWQYRNTAAPPYTQASRTVQIRKVGETNWTTIITGASTTQIVTLTPTGGYILESTQQYEWRVQATDTNGVTSNWSSVATFWVVPATASGPQRPLPSSTIDGATLGCGKHRAFVFRRGGKTRVGEIRNFSYLDWGRMRDDLSTAKIVVDGWDIDCGNLLARLQAWAYEIVIFRDNGFSVDRVWEGPITLLTYERNSVTIQAKDVMAYAYRRILKQAMVDSGGGDTVVSRAARVLQNSLAPDDPNLLQYLTVLTQSDDAREYRSTPAYSRTAFEEVDDMAANAGLDYTAVGRAILLWGTKHRIGTLPEFRDDDLGAPPIVSEYGMSMANRYVVADGNGVWGEATRLNELGKDPIYGLVEMLSSSWASDSPDDSGTYTQAGLQTVIDSFEGYAERSISDRYSPGSPVVVRVPDNTTLNPGALISIQQLVPGVVIPLRSTGTLRTVKANQKLDSVNVTEQGGQETIAITMSPFSRDDNSTGEEVEV